MGRRGRRADRDRRGDPLGADRRLRLRRRDRERDRPHRCRAAAGRRGRLQRLARPGALQRSDRQDDHQLRRLHHPRQPVASRSSPASRWASASSNRGSRRRTPEPGQRGDRAGPRAPAGLRPVAAHRSRTARSTRRRSSSIAFAEALVAFVVRGWTGPIVVLAVVLATASWPASGVPCVPFLLATLPADRLDPARQHLSLSRARPT